MFNNLIKHYKRIYKAILYVTVVSSSAVLAQDSAKTSLEELSLEELLNLKVTIATGKQDVIGDAPGVISMITSEEIRYSGARDIVDVIRKIPGFDFAQDVENLIGIGIRGLWAQEGKVLLLIDGLEMHENIYSTLQFLQHYPITNVKQIEVIRGPGSVIYGGNAELAVINIITKKGEDTQGISVYGQYGLLDKTFARRQAAISAGNSFNNGLSFNIYGMFHEGNLSSTVIPRNDSLPELNYLTNSNIKAANINTSLQYKNTEIKYLYDEHQHDVTGAGFGYNHMSHIANLKHTFKIKNKLKIVPQVLYKAQFPWNYINADNDTLQNENFYTRRIEGNVTAYYDASEKYTFLFGARYMNDFASYYSKTGNLTFNYSGTSEVNYFNYAFYTQAKLKWNIFTLEPGLRFEKHNVYGAVVVPRINLTRKIGKWNIDLQYNEAFRAPAILNIDLNTAIKPEKTYDKELELSYRISTNSIASLTLFHIDIINPIIYTFNGINEFYENDSRTGSMGFETEYRFKDEKQHLEINYSFYMPNNNKVDEFEVEDNNSVFIAFPNMKVSANYSLFITKHVFINSSQLFYSERHGYNSNDEVFKLKPALLSGISIGFTQLFHSLDVILSVNDLLDQRYEFIQAYRSGSNPMPGPGREYTIKLRYNLGFNQK